MDYLILNHTDPNGPGPTPGTPEFEAFMGRWMAYNQMLIDGGHWVSGASLTPPDIGTTVHKVDGTVTATTDGPYSEAKEQIGGFYLVSAADLDEAMKLAGAMPVENGALEVRPVAFRPDA